MPELEDEDWTQISKDPGLEFLLNALTFAGTPYLSGNAAILGNVALLLLCIYFRRARYVSGRWTVALGLFGVR